jgi:beta-lactamase class A
MRQLWDKVRRHLLLVFLIFGIGFGVGAFAPLPEAKTAALTLSQGARELNESYTYISPLLACPEVELDHLGNDEVNVLERALRAAVVAHTSKKEIIDAGIYFRQLKGGPWLGINHDALFYPRSLLKVPLAMAFYKKTEGDPRLYDTRVKYREGSVGVHQYFGKDVVEIGTEYSVDELVEAALIYSDNTAAFLLASVITIEDLQETYADLGIEKPRDATDYQISVHDYASFFRILYNATYNTRKDSEHILEHLADTAFTKGLVAGLPPGVSVSHKFGEQSDATGAVKQLHDCGIVYHPEKPYLICIMTTGRDFEQMAEVIADLSRIVYTSVAK